MKNLIYFSVFVLMVSVLLSCDNSIDPINREKGIYSVYGSLNIDDNINYIRVKELNKPLLADSTKEIDAEVELTNLDTGNSEILTDSVIKLDNIYTHNFYTTMNITPNTDYELIVERSDGRSVTAQTASPEIANRRVNPTNETCYTPIKISFQPVLDSEDVRVNVGFEYQGDTYYARGLPQDRESPNTLSLTFTPKEIIDRRFGSLIGIDVRCYELSSKLLQVEYRHYGPDFLEGTESDTLPVPGGTSRFGAYYDSTFTFPIDTSEVL